MPTLRALWILRKETFSYACKHFEVLLAFAIASYLAVFLPLYFSAQLLVPLTGIDFISWLGILLGVFTVLFIIYGSYFLHSLVEGTGVYCEVARMLSIKHRITLPMRILGFTPLISEEDDRLHFRNKQGKVLRQAYLAKAINIYVFNFGKSGYLSAVESDESPFCERSLDKADVRYFGVPGWKIPFWAYRQAFRFLKLRVSIGEAASQYNEIFLRTNDSGIVYHAAKHHLSASEADIMCQYNVPYEDYEKLKGLPGNWIQKIYSEA